MEAKRPTLGVVAISYNEERDLPAFLEHLQPWVDEIVLVDDESTDRTPEIAQAAGGKVRLSVHKMEAEKGFAGQRNFGNEPPRRKRRGIGEGELILYHSVN